MKSKSITFVEGMKRANKDFFSSKETSLTEKGIIQPFQKRRLNQDTCGINRDKNPCGDASEY